MNSGERREPADDESNRVIEKPLFAGLEELFIVVSDGYYGYRRGKAMCFYDREAVEGLKQRCHDRAVLKLIKDSTLAKMPRVEVLREDELEMF